MHPKIILPHERNYTKKLLPTAPVSASNEFDEPVHFLVQSIGTKYLVIIVFRLLSF
jgi:hypothetical protein